MLNNKIQYGPIIGLVWTDLKSESETERLTVVCPRCRQNHKFGHFSHVVGLTSAGEKYSKMRAARATRSFLPLLTNNITAFWRCRCRSRCRFLNSLIST